MNPRGLHLIVRFTPAVTAAIPWLAAGLAAELAGRGTEIEPREAATHRDMPEVRIWLPGQPDRPTAPGRVAEIRLAGEASPVSPGVLAIDVSADSPGRPAEHVIAVLDRVGLLPAAAGPPGAQTGAAGTAGDAAEPGNPGPGDEVYSEAEADIIAQRLAALGYIE